MKGYIGVTAREWFMHLTNKASIGEVNFWRKNTNQFKVLSKGEPFFFLVKNAKGNNGERAVFGKATFERFEVLTVDKAWEKYGDGNGDESKGSFLKRMNSMFETDSHSGTIGCIILSDFKQFNSPVYLSHLNIEFKNSVVSGKSISETEVNTILKQGFKTVETIKQQLHEAEQIGYSDDDEGFPEGKYMLKLHLIRERNRGLIKLAKERYLQEHGKLICQVCRFDFKERYGEIGDGYIEGHHTKPISEMDENEKTRIEDIALVCSNCHRMLHRKRPWLTLDQLNELIK